MSKVAWWKCVSVIIVVWAMTGIAAPAQVFNTLYEFDGANGEGNPVVSLVQGRDGNFYGTTSASTGPGAVFRINPAGELTTLYSFCSQPNCADGESPYGGLLLATDGNFYGTTYEGGSNPSCGTIFRITPQGMLTTLHNFTGLDGSNPIEPLIQGSDGDFYGTTPIGGSNAGVLFKITSTGEFTLLYDFGNGDNGAFPHGTLIQARDGNFYGTTYEGTVFRYRLDGTLTTLYHLSYLKAGLLEASDGNFYGTTYQGGFGCNGYGCGTVFKITPGGRLSTVHFFQGTDGAESQAPLIQATDGNLYGMTASGGANNVGTIYRIMPGGRLTTLYSFCSQPKCSDGEAPFGGPLQATTGMFYGTTAVGGKGQCSGSGCGTVFSLDMGLGPFVSFVRRYGRVGQSGGILGQGFIGTVGVSFNGTPASFTVVSDTFIRATVPVGATTGYVTVATPTGTLTSNVPFRVIK